MNNRSLKTFILVENHSYEWNFFGLTKNEFNSFIKLIKEEESNIAKIKNTKEKVLFKAQENVSIKPQFCGLFSFENTYILVFPKIFNHMKFKHKDFKIIFKTIVKYLKNTKDNVIKVGKYEYDNSSKEKPEYHYFWRFVLADKIVNLYNKYGLVFPLIKQEITNNWSNVDWNKTISKSLIYLDDNNFPIFDKLISHKLDEDRKHFIAEIHAMILNEIYQLRSLSSEPNVPFIYNIKQFLNREKVSYYIKVLNEEFWKTNIEWKKEVFNLLIDYLEGKYLKSENKIWIAAGSKLFDAIWQKACSDVYGNHLNDLIKDHALLINTYPNDKTTNTIKNIFKKIETPPSKKKDKEEDKEIVPDQVWVLDENRKIFILDAKNYKDFKSTDREIYKQYVYSFYFYKLLWKEKNIRIFNCFLIPDTSNNLKNSQNIINWRKIELSFFDDKEYKDLNFLWEFKISMIKTFEYYLKEVKIDLSNFNPEDLEQWNLNN